MVVLIKNPNSWAKTRTFAIFETKNVRKGQNTSIFFKFFQKKGLTDKKKSGILCKLARAGAEKAAGRVSGPNLENDTEERETRKKKDSEDSEEFRCWNRSESEGEDI